MYQKLSNFLLQNGEKTFFFHLEQQHQQLQKDVASKKQSKQERAFIHQGGFCDSPEKVSFSFSFFVRFDDSVVVFAYERWFCIVGMMREQC